MSRLIRDGFRKSEVVRKSPLDQEYAEHENQGRNKRLQILIEASPDSRDLQQVCQGYRRVEITRSHGKEHRIDTRNKFMQARQRFKSFGKPIEHLFLGIEDSLPEIENLFDTYRTATDCRSDADDAEQLLYDFNEQHYPSGSVNRTR